MPGLADLAYALFPVVPHLSEKGYIIYHTFLGKTKFS
jgi:hypothetical protein